LEKRGKGVHLSEKGGVKRRIEKKGVRPSGRTWREYREVQMTERRGKGRGKNS